MTSETIEVLYVEDDAADADFAETAFREIGCRLQLRVVTDGEAAADYLGLGNPERPGQARRPAMILLDLNIPRLHGKELLKRIKESAELKKIPVVILSTSRHQHDVDETYALGAAGYFMKPASFKEYKGIFSAICDYWTLRATLPSQPLHN